MKKTILLFGVFLASFAFAQVSIAPKATTSVPQPDPQATLDVRAMNAGTPDGILIPRLARTKAEGMGGTIQESTMIYIDAIDGTAGTKTADVDTKGFYYYNGTKWVKVGGVPSKSVRTTATAVLTPSDVNGYVFITGGTALEFDLDNLNPSDGDTITFANFNGFVGFGVVSSSGKIAAGSTQAQANPGAGLAFIYDAQSDKWYSYSVN